MERSLFRRFLLTHSRPVRRLNLSARTDSREEAAPSCRNIPRHGSIDLPGRARNIASAHSCHNHFMPQSQQWAFPESLQPKAGEVGFDLTRALDSIVLVRAIVPDDAFTAGVLGTERGGYGVSD